MALKDDIVEPIEEFVQAVETKVEAVEEAVETKVEAVEKAVITNPIIRMAIEQAAYRLARETAK